jgi:hypothetical protein
LEDAGTLIGIVIAIVAMGFGRLLQVRTTKRRMAKVQALAIAAAPEGEQMRVAGVVHAVDPVITAQISQRACVVCEIRIETFDEGWWPLVVTRTGVVFAIDDGSGHVLVDPADAELAIEASVTSHEVREADLTAQERALLAEHGLVGHGEGDPAKRKKIQEDLIRFRESVILVGARIAVVGAGIGEADEQSQGYREIAMRLRFSASKRSPLLITDDAKLAGA